MAGDKDSMRAEARVSPILFARGETVSEILQVTLAEVWRRCLDEGMAVLESRIAAQYSFQNSILVREKLKRRSDLIADAIEQLERNPGSVEAGQKAIEALKSATTK